MKVASPKTESARQATWNHLASSALNQKESGASGNLRADLDAEFPMPKNFWSVSILMLAAGCAGTGGESRATQNDGPAINAGPSLAPTTCIPYVVPATTDLATPTVSFGSDVYPIFASAGCSAGGCHGSTGENQGLFLGNDINAVYANLVGTPAEELSTMNFVTAMSPTTSYMMHKLDHDECTLATQCGDGCGADMPLGGLVLSVAVRDTIRRWIAQGALHN